MIIKWILRENYISNDTKGYLFQPAFGELRAGMLLILIFFLICRVFLTIQMPGDFGTVH